MSRVLFWVMVGCSFVGMNLGIRIEILAQTSTKDLDEVGLSHRVLRMAEGKFFGLSQDTEHGFLQLKWLPTSEEIAELESLGVKLQGYVGEQTYIASFQKSTYASLQKLEIVRGTSPHLPEDKVEPYLLSKINSPPGWFFDEAGDLKVNIRFFADVSFEEAKESLEGFGVDVRQKDFYFAKHIKVSLSYWGEAELLELGRLQEVRWISSPVGPVSSQNQFASTLSHALDVSFEDTYGLTGRGVHVGIWDGGMVDGSHPDLGRRVHAQEEVGISYHATHVAGTIGGTGKNDPLRGARGMAPGAEMYSYSYKNEEDREYEILNEKFEAYGNRHSALVIDNNSWGASIGWNRGAVPVLFGLEASRWIWYDNTEQFGQYNGISEGWDILAHEAPQVTIVKSSNNDGDDGHEGTHYHYDFETEEYDKKSDAHPHDGTLRGGVYYDLLGSRAVAKNVLTVGATDDVGRIAEFSSTGPTDDLRIKPDVVANGTAVRSTMTEEDDVEEGGFPEGCEGELYCSLNGTSMATPVVSGVAALFVEAYREAFDRDPMSAEVKAALIHTAADLDGRDAPGPNPKYGYGHVHARHAVELIAPEAGREHVGPRLQHHRIETRQTHRYVVEVEDATKPLVVTIAWNDREGEPLAVQHLVNDLDVEVNRVGKPQVYYPWRIERVEDGYEAKNNRKNPRDNVEKVEVPRAGMGRGRWVVTVRGDAIAMGSQDYAIAFSHAPRKQQGLALEGTSYEGCLRGPESTDMDEDLWDDGCEYRLAEAFKPLVRFYSEEQSFLMRSYWAVQPMAYGSVRIFYALGYQEDARRIEDRLGFTGDPEYIVLDVEEVSPSQWVVQRAALSKSRAVVCADQGQDPFRIEEELIPEWMAGDKLDYADGVLGGRPLIHVAANHHSNFRSLSACHRGTCIEHRCIGVVAEQSAEVSVKRNLGNGTHPLNQAESVMIEPREFGRNLERREERFWDTEWKYCGFQVELEGNRKNCALAEESYGNSLPAFGFGRNLGECGDLDGDGFISDAPECGGVDCNDADPLVHPNSPIEELQCNEPEACEPGSCEEGQWCDVDTNLCTSCDAPNAPENAECGVNIEFDPRIHKRLSTGTEHACYLSLQGEVYCWGRNEAGELGTDPRENAQGELENIFLVPLPVVEGERVISISSGGSATTCALLNTGKAFCWGEGWSGSLGLGDPQNRGDNPGEIEALLYVDFGMNHHPISFSSAELTKWAIFDHGLVKGWGGNYDGSLGLGGGVPEFIGDGPDEMGENLPIIDLGMNQSAVYLAQGPGLHRCALLESGCLKCWGPNFHGELGYGDEQSRGVLDNQLGDNLFCVDLGEGTVTDVGNGMESFSCAVLDGQRIKCWGLNYRGQLGLGDEQSRGDDPGEMGENLFPVDLGEMPGEGPIRLAVGWTYSCAYNRNSIKCWGENLNGVLGVPVEEAASIGESPGEMGDNLLPVDLGDVPPILEVSTGYYFTCALFVDERIKCWGANWEGQLGNGDREYRGDDPGEMGDNLPYVRLPGQ